MEKFKMPKYIDIDCKYIICPDIRCNGFCKDHMDCTNTEYSIKLIKEINNDNTAKFCPHLDKAKMVVFCYHGHVNERPVNTNTWCRVDCNTKNCHSSTFTLMSNTTYRIPLSKYKEFLKLPRTNCVDYKFIDTPKIK